ncbi:MAG TPA: hypothetical protein VGZ22_25480 [Isosphaeraceae bacterium]|jgi:hypothetical protein|nr:hypothetical protein [Isosphaeraceae bacterium]
MLPTILLILGISWDDMMRRRPPQEPPSAASAPSAPSLPSRAVAPPVAPPLATEPQVSKPTTPPPATPAAGEERFQPSVTLRPTSGPAPPPRPTAPTIWQMADSGGQVWTHTDPSWLRQWVSQRNQDLANAAAIRQRTVVPLYWTVPMGGSCPTGNCPRR